jgi:hypothetical protein
MDNQGYFKFFSEKEFDLQQRMAEEYISFLGQKVYLYPINHNESDIDSLYNEGVSTEIRLEDPIELQCIVEMVDPTNKAYNDDNTFRILELGNLLLHILTSELNKKKCFPKYGDYILFQAHDNISPENLVYQIVNDASRTFENVKTFGGFKTYYKTIICTPVDKGELQFEY